MDGFIEAWLFVLGIFYALVAVVLSVMSMLFFLKIGSAKRYSGNPSRRGGHYLWLAVASGIFSVGAFSGILWLRGLGAILYVADFIFHMDLRTIGGQPFDKDMIKGIRLSMAIIFGILLKCFGLVMLISLIV